MGSPGRDDVSGKRVRCAPNRRALALLLGTIAVAAQAAGRLERPQNAGGVAEPAARPGPSSPAPGNLIAYTGLDGNVYVVDPDGGEFLAVTTDAEIGRKEYRLAAWHPDGETLAFVQVTSPEGGTPTSRILVTPALSPGSGARSVHEASGTAPLYLSWSPEGGRLGFLESPAQEGGSLELLTVSPAQGRTERISSGRPLYWDWSADGSRIVIHAGIADPQGQLASTSLATHEWSSGAATDDPLQALPAAFQSPDVAGSGAFFVMAGFATSEARDGRDAHLFLVSAAGDIIRELVGVQGLSAFQLSPGEDRLAFIDGAASPYGGIMGSLGVVLLTGEEEEEPRLVALTEAEDVMAFFWSPDGSSIVFFRPQVAAGRRGRFLTVEASLLDVETGEIRALAVFQPAPDFMSQLVPYFDQYQRSATIWAPDSRAFTINVVASGQPAVAVVPIDPEAEPRIVAYGTLPFWSPRSASPPR